MTDRLRLIAEHSLTYAPHHVAEHLGFFADEGLEIVTNYESGPGGSWLSDVLASGAADIARGGVWIPMMYRGFLEDIRIFATLCHRNNQVILARDAAPNFSLELLLGKQVMLPLAATSQWMYIKGLFMEQGIPWEQVLWLRDLEVTAWTRLWRAGYADYFLTSAPLTDGLLAEGYYAALKLADTGPVPWSVYYAPRAVTETRAEELNRMRHALSKAVAWMEQASPAEMTKLIAKDFPKFDVAWIERSLERMMLERTWSRDLTVPVPAFKRYQKIIASYGLVNPPLPPEVLISDGTRTSRLSKSVA